VWSDDFDDGNYDGWTVRTGNFTAEDFTLRANATMGESDIYINSTVATGTWQWSMYSVNPDNVSRVFFIHCPILSSQTLQDYITAYSIEMDPMNRNFTIQKWEPSDTSNWNNIILDMYTAPSVIDGWQHIMLTRDDNGFFHVWINGTLRMSAIDDEFRTAGIFRFACTNGSAIDNIAISDTLDRTPEPSDFQFTDEELVIICERNYWTSARFGVKNFGEAIGRVKIELNPVLLPLGITISGFGFYDSIESNETHYERFDIGVIPECIPGIYHTNLELRDFETEEVLDTLHLIIIVTFSLFSIFPPIPEPLGSGLVVFLLEFAVIAIVLLFEFYLRKRKELK
jgi:hypothetical protein